MHLRTARLKWRRLAFTAALLLVLLGIGDRRSIVIAQTSNGAVPGAIQAYSTITSIGIEWDIVGDADHDATAGVEYRVAGATAWRSALPLVRVDYNGFNLLAGSILFLDPGTSYEVRLTLADPDGGAAVQTVVVTTRPIPAFVPIRTFHVVPGAGGGSGAPPSRTVRAAGCALRAPR